MKRNRLIRPSETNSFSTSKKKRPLKKLSFLALGGVCLTSIVLATSKPVEKGLDAQIIDLPGLPAANQTTSQNILILPTKVDSSVKTTEAVEIATSELSVSAKPDDDLALLEQNQIDQIVGNQPIDIESNNSQKTNESI
jgi:hypothetical protein